MTTATILETRNPAWGFFGTMSQAGQDPAAAWAAASVAIAEAIGDHDDYAAEGIRHFLDSRLGRHFADTVVNAIHRGLPLEAAISSAIDEWQSLRITRRISRTDGIPAGLPYLTGWVQHYTILHDEVAAH